MITFRTTIELNGKTATGLRVPADVVAALGSGKKPRVTVTLGDHRYRSTVAVYGGEFMLPLSAANRTSAGVSAGDEVTVGVELDTLPRTVEVPDDLARALEQDTEVERAFHALSYSSRRGHVESIEAAKTTETRERRIAKLISSLRTP